MEPRQSEFLSIIKYLLISYAFSWLAWLPGILVTRGILSEIPWPPLFALGACGPLAAAVWLTCREFGWEGLKGWLRAGFMKPIKRLWWMVILAAPFLIPPLALGLDRLAGGTHQDLMVLERPAIILPALLLMLTIGGAQEEFGWRGYLLPRLDGMVKPWQADLLTIFFHVGWHIPLFFIAYTVQYQYSLWLFLAFGTGFTYLANTIYRENQGSILAALLFHGLTNTGLEIFPPVGSFVSNSPLPLLIVGGTYAVLGGLLKWLIASTNSPEQASGV